jgi:hypothetical protein
VPLFVKIWTQCCQIHAKWDRSGGKAVGTGLKNSGLIQMPVAHNLGWRNIGLEIKSDSIYFQI